MRLSSKIVSTIVGVGGPLGWQALRQRRRISFEGRSVVITGGSRGLGLLLARELAREGARLALLARDAAELERAAADVLHFGREVLTVACDVTDEAAVYAAIAQVIAQFGGVDVLINNAGVIAGGPVEHMGVDDFAAALNVHFWGPLYTMRAVIPHMRQRGGGRIVNVASIGGKVAVPHLVPYSASKFALVGLSDGMRAELAKDGILVTTVSPGLMRTGSAPNALFKGQHRREFTLFALLDALPGISMDAGRAARQVVEACRFGDPQVVLSLPAKALVLANALVPNLFATAIALTTRLLPGPTDAAGDQSRTGWESQTPLAPSPLTYLSDRATDRNNELNGHAPLT